MELCSYIYEKTAEATVLRKAHSGHVYTAHLAKAVRMETGSNGGYTGDTATLGHGLTVSEHTCFISCIYQI